LNKVRSRQDLSKDSLKRSCRLLGAKKVLENNSQQINNPLFYQNQNSIVSSLLNTDKQTLNTIQEKNGVDITEERVSEWIKSRENPLYFILNYVYFQEFGGKQLYSREYMHAKFRRTVRTIFRYHMAILMASRQLGKALSLDTPIPLASGGYTTMGDINVGDWILDGSGNPTQVVATTGIMYNRPCYQFEFDNGDTIKADENHLWKISNSTIRIKDELKTSKEIFELQDKLLKLKSSTFCKIELPKKIEYKSNSSFNLARKNQDCNFFRNEIINVCISSIKKIESVPVRCIQVANNDGMFLCGESMIPTHNSTIAAGILTWALTFFPSNRAAIFNFQKLTAQENLKKIKFIIKNLPPWMRVPNLSKSEIKTYLELQNGSRVDTFYPSTTTSPDTLSRSLSVPIIYIDEVAFISHMEEIYGAAQPTLSKAREQAIRNGYPYMILMTSTPNGVDGDGKFFYEMYDRAIESDNLFVMNKDTGIEEWSDSCDEIVNDASKNSFIRIKYHWSEDPTKDLEWYEKQKKELNFNQRKINQELDLLFVGGDNCIFDDDTLQRLVFVNRDSVIDLKHQTKLDLFTSNFDQKDYYLIGIDTASSIKGAFNSIEIFSYKDFNQIGEMNVRLGSLVKYGEVIDDLFKWLYKIVGQRILLGIENNSIGKAIIEHLLYHVNDFNYIPYIYKDLRKSEIPGQMIDMTGHEYGINTNTRTKELMVSLFYDAVIENPSRIKSQGLIGQMSAVQRSNRGTIRSNTFSDMFMAACFCAYVRKMTQLQIMPLLDYSNAQISQNFFSSIKTAAEMMNTKLIIQADNKRQVNQIIEKPRTVQEDDMLTQQYQQQLKTNTGDTIVDDWRTLMPIISPFD